MQSLTWLNMNATLKLEILDTRALEVIQGLEILKQVRAIPEKAFDPERFMAMAGSLSKSEAGDVLEISWQLRHEWER